MIVVYYFQVDIGNNVPVGNGNTFYKKGTRKSIGLSMKNIFKISIMVR